MTTAPSVRLTCWRVGVALGLAFGGLCLGTALEAQDGGLDVVKCAINCGGG